jgi:hypothetical protein
MHLQSVPTALVSKWLGHATAGRFRRRHVVRSRGPAPGGVTLPIAVWEFSLGVYLIVKGVKPSPITAAHGDCLTMTDHRYPASLAGRS